MVKQGGSTDNCGNEGIHMRKSAYLWHITVNIHLSRSLSGRLNRELAFMERSEKSFWLTPDKWPCAYAPYHRSCVGIKGTIKSLLRVDLSFSSMPYYPSDLNSLSPTNTVKICAMSVEKRPYFTPLLSGPTLSYVTVTCDIAQCFHSVFC